MCCGCVIVHMAGGIHFRLLSRIVQRLHMHSAAWLLYWGLGTSAYLHSSLSTPTDLWSQSHHCVFCCLCASKNVVSPLPVDADFGPGRFLVVLAQGHIRKLQSNTSLQLKRDGLLPKDSCYFECSPPWCVSLWLLSAVSNSPLSAALDQIIGYVALHEACGMFSQGL